jgi:soluble lytic murein transglycosylase-like protein
MKAVGAILLCLLLFACEKNEPIVVTAPVVVTADPVAIEVPKPVEPVVVLTSPERSWKYHRSMQQSAWRIFGPAAPVATLAAQIEQESGWRCDVVSHAGAQGCGQFMPLTAADMAKNHPSECSPANVFDPDWAFRCRDLYMKSLMKQVKSEMGTECDDWAFSLKAYNGGAGWVKRDKAKAKAAGADIDDWRVVSQYNAGRSPANFKENTEYPVRIFRIEPKYQEWGRQLECL